MNQKTTPDATSSSSFIFTEADVTAWLAERAKSYGIDGLLLDIAAGTHRSRCTASVPKPGEDMFGHHYGFGDSLDAAVADVRPKIKPAAEIAAELRAKAAALAAEADKLAPQVVPTPVIQEREGAAA